MVNIFIIEFLVILNTVMCNENAVILILCRNSDLDGITKSILSFEEIFNRVFNYPYLFFNNEKFTTEFKAAILKIVSSPVEFGQLNDEEWGMPSFINKARAKNAMEDLGKRGIIYGGLESYHKMCRWFSGYFYRTQLIRKYDYYWRIEPDVTFHCKLNYDPFKYLKENNKVYGFNIAMFEFMETIPTLWHTVTKFLDQYPTKIPSVDRLKFIFNMDRTYNGCHFWSNFEIGDLRFFRTEIYDLYFDYLDRSGGFFYERWGDAPVHTIAVALFAGLSKIHYFSDIGYTHGGMTHYVDDPLISVHCNYDKNPGNASANFGCITKYLAEI